MSYILNIETSTHICSVALAKNGNLIGLKESFEDKTHAELLTVFIEDILEENKVETKDLAAIAISEGPGSYTGLRIGFSVTKGLCYGLNIPLITIPTLKAMANGARKNIKAGGSLLCPMIDARRREVYTSVFNENLDIISDVHAKIIDNTSFKELLPSNKLYFFGTGSDKCKTEIISDKAQFIDDTYISAKYMIDLSLNKFEMKDFEDIAYSEPFYLKEFQAIKSTKKYF